MIKVRVYKFQRRAIFHFEEFTKEHDEEIIGINRHSRTVMLRNGDEIHFICQSSFDNWQRGRKYQIEEWE